MIFRNGLVAFFCPASQSDAGGCWGRVRALPPCCSSRTPVLFGGQLRIFDHAAHCTGDGVALSGNIFHGTSPELVGHAPPLKHREVSHAQQALTAEFFVVSCHTIVARGRSSSANHSGGSTPLMGVKQVHLYSGLACRGFRPAPCAPLVWATPGTPRRSSHMRHSRLNFIFRGYKNDGAGSPEDVRSQGFDPPSPQTVENYYHFNRSRAVFALWHGPAQTLQITVGISAAMRFRDDVVNGFRLTHHTSMQT